MNCLITGAVSCTDKLTQLLKSLGHEVHFLQDEKAPISLPYEEVQAVFSNGLFLHHDICWFKNLRYIQLTSAGFDRVPMDYVKEHNITIHNARGVYSVPMAEFALSGILQLYKQSKWFYDNQKEHLWNKNRSLMELSGKTACILGCGSVGSECAKRLSVFGVTVRGMDITPFKSPFFETMVGLEKLDNLLQKSDIVVLCLPLTSETTHLFDTKRLSLMKKGSVLVNIARGKIVETEALITALKTTLRGAVLDVFEQEPLPEDSPLWDMENVILTPHNSFVGEGNSERLFEVIKNNLESYS